MKAIVWTEYGSPDVLQLREVATPTPKPAELLIRVHATTVTAGDCEMRRLDFPLYLALPIRLWVGLLKPRGTTIPGTEFSGEVVAVGAEVAQFRVGDAVYGSAGMRLGTAAELTCQPEAGAVARKPSAMTYDEAATVPFGGCDALHFLRRGEVGPGERVLINGAGGSIGTYAVQLAKHFGAEVTAVDSAAKLEMLRALGADEVVDYTREDVPASGAVYDVIFDVVGTLSLPRIAPSLAADGRVLLANPGMSQRLDARRLGRTGSRRVVLEPSSPTAADLDYLRGLVDAGKLRAVIDRRYPLAEMREAHRYVETGHKQGHVVITV